jgi:hypothetical protein
LFTEKKNRANRDEPSRIPPVPEVSKTVPNAVSNLSIDISSEHFE